MYNHTPSFLVVLFQVCHLTNKNKQAKYEVKILEAESCELPKIQTGEIPKA